MKIGLVSLLCLAAWSFRKGESLIEGTSDPENGTVLSLFEGAANVTFQCSVIVTYKETATPVQTVWRLTLAGGDPELVGTNNNFNVTIGGGVFQTTTGLNLTRNMYFVISEVTDFFNGASISCGAGDEETDLAIFSIRIYKPPVLTDVGMVNAIENTDVDIDLGTAASSNAYPPPQLTSLTPSNVLDADFLYPIVSLKTVKREQSGEYSLTATNYLVDNPSVQVGDSTGTFSLNVQYPPEVGGELFREVAEEVMRSVTLQCGDSITANPTPSVQWTDSSGSPVSNGGRFTITGDLGTVLEISDNTMSDEGNWTCEVSNSIGYASVVFLLTVLRPPSVPNNVSLETDGTIVVNDPTTKIAINWQAPQDPGSPQFTSYRVEAVSRDGVVFPFSATDRHLVLTGLLPGTTYNIQVFAVVEFGGVVLLGPPSANLTANTTESVPALQCVGTTADNGGVLVEWNVDHTGGQDLELTEILVQYKLITDAQFQDISDPADVSRTSVLVEEQFVAGSIYEFRVQAGNTIGYSSFAACDSAIIEEGIPAMPAKPVGESTAPGVVTLQLETLHSGIGESDSPFAFVVRIQLLSSGRAKDNTEVEFSMDDYQSGTVVLVTIRDLEGGAMYLFSALASNDFGNSSFSGNSDPISVQAEGILLYTVSVASPSPTATVTPTASSGASCTSPIVISCVVTSAVTFALAFALGVLAHAVAMKTKNKNKSGKESATSAAAGEQPVYEIVETEENKGAQDYELMSTGETTNTQPQESVIDLKGNVAYGLIEN